MSKLDLSYPKIIALFGAHAVTQRTESRQFLAWFLRNYYRLEESEVDDCICDGQYDKGVDGVYVHEQLGQIDVFQSRLVKGKKTQGDAALHEFYGVLAQFRDEAAVRNMEATTTNKELTGLLRSQEIAERVKEGYEVQGVFLTNATRDKNAIDFLKSAPDLILYDEISLQKLFVPIDKTEPIQTEISFDVSGVPVMDYPIDQETKMVIAPVAAHELVKMQGIPNGELFAWNVRQWLRKTKVNKDIENSIKRQTEHKYFPAFHNGLTVLCTNLDPSTDKIKISGYAVVNGCQSLTGLYENKKLLTSDLRILTKFIRVAHDTPLANKITDHTNNQNGTTARDLQSNNPIQTRLQGEINSRYSGTLRYRIKRGEHPEWPAEKVIENDLAARILLAFNLKQPWSCHQTYRLFDELHASIFTGPDIDADRIVIAHDIYQCVMGKLELIKNQLFARYGLTRFLLLYLLREALESDEMGKQFWEKPAKFFGPSRERNTVLACVDKVAKVVTRLLDSEIKRRDAEVQSPFDYKRELKSPRPVRELAGTVVSHYQIAVDGGLAPTFTGEWKKINNGKSKKVKVGK